MADFTAASLDVWYERAGKYQHDAGMAIDDADRRAYLEMKGVKS